MAAEQKVSKRVERELNQTKVIVRHLPPDLELESFLEKFGPRLPPESFNYFYFSPGDPELGPQGCARAYINFVEELSILQFRDEFDGMVLDSQKGQRYRVLIEYAPFQSAPKPRKKPDSRCGTIEQDGEYQAFLQSRKQEAESLPTLAFETYMEEMKANEIPEVQVTPLIAYLRNKKSGTKSSKKKQVFVVEKKKKSGTGKRERGRADAGSSSRREKEKVDGGRKKNAESTRASKRFEQEESSAGREGKVDHSRGRDTVEFDATNHGLETWGGGGGKTLQEIRQNGDVVSDLKEGKGRGRSAGQRKPDRTIYVPRSCDWSHDYKETKSRGRGTADIEHKLRTEDPFKSDGTHFSNDKHSSESDSSVMSRDGSPHGRGKGRRRGRGRGRGGRGHGQPNTHEGSWASSVPNY